MAVRQHVTTHELLVVPLRYRPCFLKPNKNKLWQGIVTTDLLKIYSACSYQSNIVEKPSAVVKQIGEVGRPSSRCRATGPLVPKLPPHRSHQK